MLNRYLGGIIKNEADLIDNWYIDQANLEGVTILVSIYNYEDYAGNAWVLFIKDDELYEVNGSHCSCFGLEGQWEPEKTSLEAIRHRLHNGTYFDYDPMLKQIIAELVG